MMPLNRNKTHLQFNGFSSHGRAFSTERPHPALPGYVRSPSSTMRVPPKVPASTTTREKNLHKLVPVREVSNSGWRTHSRPVCVCFIILTLNSLRASCPGSDLFAHKAVIFQKQPVSCPPPLKTIVRGTFRILEDSSEQDRYPPALLKRANV